MTNPYLMLLGYFIYMHQIRLRNFDKKFLSIIQNVAPELFRLLQNNTILHRLERNRSNPEKKIVDAAEYFRVPIENKKILNDLFTTISETNLNFEPTTPPSLLQLSLQAVSLYTNKAGFFKKPVLAIKTKNKKIGVQLVKKIPHTIIPYITRYYPPKIELFYDMIINHLDAKKAVEKTSKKIKQLYGTFYSAFVIEDVLKYDKTLIAIVADYLLTCAIKFSKKQQFATLDFKFPTFKSDKNFIKGFSPLHFACWFKAPISLIEVLLETGCYVNQSVNPLGFSALHVACMVDSSLKVIDLLLRHKANLELRARHGLTPLYIALLYKQENIAIHLLKYGAKLEAKIHSLLTLNYIAYYYYHGGNGVHLAVVANLKKAIHYLIENNLTAFISTECDIHPLQLMCKYMDSETVELMCNKYLRNNASPIDIDHLNAADYAMVHSKPSEKSKILKILSNYGIFPMDPEERQKIILGRVFNLFSENSFGPTDGATFNP